MSDKLVEISYYRQCDPKNIKKAVVKEDQVLDIRRILTHIHIVNIQSAPPDSTRDYLLR